MNGEEVGWVIVESCQYSMAFTISVLMLVTTCVRHPTRADCLTFLHGRKWQTLT